MIPRGKCENCKTAQIGIIKARLCVPCYYKKYYQDRKEEYAERTRRWKKENPEKAREMRRKSNKKWLGKNPQWLKDYEAKRRKKPARIAYMEVWREEQRRKKHGNSKPICP